MKKKFISTLLALSLVFNVMPSLMPSDTIFSNTNVVVSANDETDNGTNTGSSATQEDFASFRENFL